MTEIPEHLRKRAEEARKKAEAARGGSDAPAAEAVPAPSPGSSPAALRRTGERRRQPHPGAPAGALPGRQGQGRG